MEENVAGDEVILTKTDRNIVDLLVLPKPSFLCTWSISYEAGVTINVTLFPCFYPNHSIR